MDVTLRVNILVEEYMMHSETIVHSRWHDGIKVQE